MAGIAVCGINCSDCAIYRAVSDPGLALRIADAISEGGTRVEPHQIKCGGCRGPRDEHWSGDCKILACCSDERRLESCHLCHEFPCAKLTDWAAGDERYTEALERLRGMRRSA